MTADENYLRESILTPAAKVTAGFQPVMPAFQGLVSEEQLLALIEYVKSLSSRRRPNPCGRCNQDEPIMAAEFPAQHYLNDGYGITSWLLTRDHKRIALLYLAAVTFFFFVGGAFAVLIRLDLATPAGDLVSDDTYNELFTMHGVVMVFFFLIPAIPADSRQLSRAADDRREGSRLSEAQSVELVHLHDRRAVGRVRAADRRRSTPAGRCTRRSARSSRRRASCRPRWRFSSPASRRS